MNKLAFCAVIWLSCAALCLAQTNQTSRDNNFHRFEIFGGLSTNLADTEISDKNQNTVESFDDRRNLNGVNASAVFNFNRYIGAKGDFSVNTRNVFPGFPRPGNANTIDILRVRSSLYNFLGGVQVKDNKKEATRFRPFGHVLVGAAVINSNIKDSVFDSSLCARPDVSCSAFDNTDAGLAAAVGGGLDIKLTRRLSIRAVQVDYNPTRLNNQTQHNVRLGVGLLFH